MTLDYKQHPTVVLKIAKKSIVGNTNQVNRTEDFVLVNRKASYQDACTCIFQLSGMVLLENSMFGSRKSSSVTYVGVSVHLG
jgi:threonine dehydrogenase-like Zn-dependent dehydrogenase